MSKEYRDPLREHLEKAGKAQTPQDRDRPWLPDWRHNFEVDTFRGGWTTVANLLNQNFREIVTWIPDTSVFRRPEAEPFWAAADKLGPSCSCVGITRTFRAETEWAMSRPMTERSGRADLIEFGLISSAPWAKRISGPPPDDPMLAWAANYYLALFSMRRFLAIGEDGGNTLIGTPVEQRAKTFNEITKLCGERAHKLALNGLRTKEKSREFSELVVSDELLVMDSFIYALRTGRPTIIITTDSDLAEIFFKAQYIIDMHYRAYRFGKLLQWGRYDASARVHQSPTSDGLFDGPLRLFPRRSFQCLEALPPHFESSQIGVLHVRQADDSVTYYRIMLDREILDMFRTKGATGGNTTDHFGDANLHVDLGPIKDELDGLHFGVAKDHLFPIRCNGVEVGLAMLDLNHVFNSKENL